ncbi:hypothetical protein EJB05_20957, partial [Eragrostis curvula]
MEWAVVTGATDGIGRAITFRLATAGLGFVLVGRNPDKLAATAAEVRAEHPDKEVRTFVLDLAGEGLAAGVEALKEAIRGLDVGVLVNSAGVCYPYARYFHEVDEELIRSLIRVNVEGVTRVTHAVLPGMVERKRGAVVNIGSGAASAVPSDPLYSVYVGTKAYVDQFSKCLYVEYKSKGIHVQCQVTTDLFWQQMYLVSNINSFCTVEEKNALASSPRGDSGGDTHRRRRPRPSSATTAAAATGHARRRRPATEPHNRLRSRLSFDAVSFLLVALLLSSDLGRFGASPWLTGALLAGSGLPRVGYSRPQRAAAGCDDDGAWCSGAGGGEVRLRAGVGAVATRWRHAQPRAERAGGVLAVCVVRMGWCIGVPAAATRFAASDERPLVVAASSTPGELRSRWLGH